MIKLVNFRSIFLLFLISMACIYFSFKVIISPYYLFALIIPIVWFIILIFKKRYILLAVSFLLISFLCSYTIIYLTNYSNKNVENQVITIQARIEDINNINSNFSYVTLSDVFVKDNKNVNALIDGNISVGLSNYNNTFYDVGYYVSFKTELTCVEPIVNNEINSFYLKNNIRYEVSKTININNVTLIEGNKTLTEQFKEYNQKLLINGLGEDEGNIAFAVLFGDREDVNDNLLEIFKTSGVMHIFAVSGLHIGLIVTLIYFLCKKLKLKENATFIVLTVLLIFYCYLCSFSAPVLRASIMALVALFAKIVLRKNDILNTLSLSGLILLTINPLNLFDVGFQMTFVSVFGIILFGSLFNKIKISNKIVKNIVLSIITSLSTQLALMPLLAKYYGYFTTWSIISNLFTIPLFSIFYTILFIINLVVLILPFLNFLFFIPKALLNLIIFLNIKVASLPFAIIKTYSFGFVGSVFYYFAMFTISKYFLVDLKPKIIISSILLVISLAFIIPSALPNISFINKMYFNSQDSAGYSTLITTKDKKYYLLNPDFSSNRQVKIIKENLESKKINKVDGILFISNQNFQAVMISSFLKEFDATIYLPKEHESLSNLNQLGVKTKELEYNKEYSINDNISVNYINYDNIFIGTMLKFNNKLYLELNSNTDYLNQDFLLFVNSHLNFLFDCVKINNATINEYKQIFKTKQFVLDSTGSFC